MLCINLYIIILIQTKAGICFSRTHGTRCKFISPTFTKFQSEIYSQDPKEVLSYKKFNVISSLEEWKKDMNDMTGIWYIFYPPALSETRRFVPNRYIRNSPLYVDHSGIVSQPDDFDSARGTYLLDSKNFHHLEDENNLVHSRRCVFAMRSGEYHSNLRAILAGRVFYSNKTEPTEIEQINIRPAMFIGQTFLETYENDAMLELVNRLKRKMQRYTPEGVEFPVENWSLYSLEGKGSEFRWMHGNEKWKLLGPFTCYKKLNQKCEANLNAEVGETDYFDDEYEEEYPVDDQYYNVVDPLVLIRKDFVPRHELEGAVRKLVESVFTNRNGMGRIRIQNEEYLKALEAELIALGDKGPDYYRDSFE